jgi:adenosylcobinamide kinase/adenosylcobinamide-phosphate guanylyltransferase
MMVFVSGGVRSGKSAFAEKYAIAAAVGRLNYIATAKAGDEEMKKRIEHHRETRRKSGAKWRTWEQPVNLADISGSFAEEDVIVLDCLTTWLNNELFVGDWQDESHQRAVFDKMTEAVVSIERTGAMLILVSNEVLSEPLPDDSDVRTYMRILGHVHQFLVDVCDEAYLLESGIPLQMKGGS